MACFRKKTTATKQQNKQPKLKQKKRRQKTPYRERVPDPLVGNLLQKSLKANNVFLHMYVRGVGVSRSTPSAIRLVLEVLHVDHASLPKKESISFYCLLKFYKGSSYHPSVLKRGKDKVVISIEYNIKGRLDKST